MEIKMLRYPTQQDWDRAKLFALGTEGKDVKTPATLKWKQDMLRCQHSPIRTLMFSIQLIGVPYWVSVHLTRHKYGVEHYVTSQRNDRQSQYDRNTAPQNALVNHILDIDAPELIQLSHVRLCSKAAKETKEVMLAIVDEVVKVCPEFKPFLIPQCEYLGGCPEIRGCGMYKENHPELFAEKKHLSVNVYQKEAMRTANVKGEYPLVLNGVLGLSGESGECTDMVKKHLFQGHSLDKEHLAKELGDVAWYLAVTAQAIGYDLETILRMNVDKLRNRYPDGFEEQRSVNRKREDV